MFQVFQLPYDNGHDRLIYRNLPPTNYAVIFHAIIAVLCSSFSSTFRAYFHVVINKKPHNLLWLLMMFVPVKAMRCLLYGLRKFSQHSLAALSDINAAVSILVNKQHASIIFLENKRGAVSAKTS